MAIIFLINTCFVHVSIQLT